MPVLPLPAGAKPGLLLPMPNKPRSSTAFGTAVQSSDARKRCRVAGSAVQSVDAAERARITRRRLALIIKHFAIAPDEQRYVLAGGNASIGR